MKGFVRMCGTGAFKLVALALGIALIAVIWTQDASVLVQIEDNNLAAIKFVAGQLPQSWGSKFESAVRGFGLEKALLVMEVVVVVKLVLLLPGYLFRRDRYR